MLAEKAAASMFPRKFGTGGAFRQADGRNLWCFIDRITALQVRPVIFMPSHDTQGGVAVSLRNGSHEK